MSKVIRINSNTENKLEEYKKLLKESTKVEELYKMIEEASDDAIIRAAIETAISYLKIYKL